MASKLVSLALTCIIVAIDNALFAGLILPRNYSEFKKEIFCFVGVALAITQVVMAAGIGQLMANPFFRVIAIAVLVWMSVQTIVSMSVPSRTFNKFTTTLKVFLYTLIANLHNMIWLGTEVKGQYMQLILLSLVTAPLFIVTAVFLAQQFERYQWVLIIGSGMMAWAAAWLILEMPKAQLSQHGNGPLWVAQVGISSLILVVGFIARELSSYITKKT